MNRDEFITANPLAIVLEQRGVRVIGGGVQRMAKCPFHKDSTPSFSLNVSTGLWNCHGGCGGGSVIDLIAKFDGISPGEVLRRNEVSKEPVAAPKPSAEDFKFATVCAYNYESATGEVVYQVVRQHAPCPEKPSGYVKTFRQRRPGPGGSWIYNMEGIERVLYRLPDVLKAKTVWVVEGEKDADTLAGLGFVATCNVGGAGKWMEGYSEALAKRHVAICGDSDEPGKTHALEIFTSLTGKAKSARLIKLPEGFKDITEYADSFKDKESAKKAVHAIHDAATPFIKGVSLPIFSVAELELGYQRHVQSLSESAFDLSKWLPGLGAIRSLVPGELVLLLGATGIGKTAALCNIAVAAWPMPTLFFELELPPELMFERLIALNTKIPCRNVEKAYTSGETLGEEGIGKKLRHLHICTQSRLNAAEIERMVIKSELKIGERPKLVLLDYIGLVAGGGKSRYERVSQIAEDLKILAKVTQTIVVVASQVTRDSTSESPEITLSSGKDSGSLENSSGLVLGMWRDKSDAATMHLRVLKATKGGAGLKLTCNYNLDTLAITERSRFSEADVPRHHQQNDP